MAEEVSLKKKTFTGIIWGALERFGPQIISFLVMIILARILTPQDYGLVGMIMVFVMVAISLVDSGFSQALIRKKDRNEVDDSTTFYFNIVIGLLLYVIMWFLAPVVSRFYNEPRLLWLTRFICIGIVCNSFSVVQRALLSIEINFKKQAIASFFGAISGGAIGIGMAYAGWGCWALVCYHIFNLGINSAMLWVLSTWRPKWTFSWTSFRILFSFGSKLAVSGLIHTLYVNGVNLVIGKVYKAADLGFYTRAQQFSVFLSSNIGGILQRVSYPVLCRFQDDDEKLREKFTTILRLSSFISFCLTMILIGVAKPMVVMLIGEKWLPAVRLLQILGFGYMWGTVYSLNLNILLVKGRSDLYLKLEIIKKIFFVAVLAALVPFGMIPLCIGIVVNSLIEVFVNSFYTKKLIGLSLWQQLRQLAPSIFYSLSMFPIILLTTIYFPGSDFIKFSVGIFIGLVYFISISYVTGSRDLKYLLSLIKKKST